MGYHFLGLKVAVVLELCFENAFDIWRWKRMFDKSV